MSDKTFDLQQVENALSQLSKIKQKAFAASCCDRLFPNYLAFYRDTNWGNPDLLKEALELIWNDTKGIKATGVEIEQLRNKIDNIIPDADDFVSNFTSAALDASVVIYITLEVLRNCNTSKVVEIATLARDTVDMFVYVIEDEKGNEDISEEYVLAHPWMVREMKKQSDDIKLLENTSELLSPEFVDQLRSSWSNDGKSNIDLD